MTWVPALFWSCTSCLSFSSHPFYLWPTDWILSPHVWFWSCGFILHGPLDFLFQFKHGFERRQVQEVYLNLCWMKTSRRVCRSAESRGSDQWIHPEIRSRKNWESNYFLSGSQHVSTGSTELWGGKLENKDPEVVLVKKQVFIIMERSKVIQSRGRGGCRTFALRSAAVEDKSGSALKSADRDFTYEKIKHRNPK